MRRDGAGRVILAAAGIAAAAVSAGPAAADRARYDRALDCFYFLQSAGALRAAGADLGPANAPPQRLFAEAADSSRDAIRFGRGLGLSETQIAEDIRRRVAEAGPVSPGADGAVAAADARRIAGGAAPCRRP